MECRRRMQCEFDAGPLPGRVADVARSWIGRSEFRAKRRFEAEIMKL